MVNEQIVFSAVLRQWSNSQSAISSESWLTPIEGLIKAIDYKTPSLLDCVCKYIEQENPDLSELTIRVVKNWLIEARRFQVLVRSTVIATDERPFSYGGIFRQQLDELRSTIAAVSDLVDAYKNHQYDGSDGCDKWEVVVLRVSTYLRKSLPDIQIDPTDPIETTDRERKLRVAFEKVQNNQETSFPSALQFAGLEPSKANEQAVKRLASTPEQVAKLKRTRKGRPSKE